MIQSIGDFLVIYCMDGALAAGQMGALEVDRLTAQLFISLGGRLTVASRCPQAILPRCMGDFPISAPAITCAGGVVYDAAAGKVVRSEALPREEALAFVRGAAAAFRGVGIAAVGGDRTYLLRAGGEAQRWLAKERLSYILAPDEDTAGRWNELLLFGDGQTLAQLQRFALEGPYPDIALHQLEENVLCALARRVGADDALHALCDYLGLARENTVVIGADYADIPLMRAAGSAIAVGGAPQEVRQCAGALTGRSEDGGLAQALYGLLRKYGAAPQDAPLPGAEVSP